MGEEQRVILETRRMAGCERLLAGSPPIRRHLHVG